MSVQASIWDQGIGLPLPPPSVIDAPVQLTTVRGEIVGGQDLGDNAVLVVLEHQTENQAELALDSKFADEFAVDLTIDLRENCLELWVETERGAGGSTLFHAQLGKDETISVVSGCPSAFDGSL